MVVARDEMKFAGLACVQRHIFRVCLKLFSEMRASFQEVISFTEPDGDSDGHIHPITRHHLIWKVLILPNEWGALVTGESMNFRCIDPRVGITDENTAGRKVSKRGGLCIWELSLSEFSKLPVRIKFFTEIEFSVQVLCNLDVYPRGCR